MCLEEKSEMSLVRENTKRELTKEEKYTRVIDICLADVYKVCLYLTRDGDRASMITKKVLLDFYNNFETMIDFDSDNFEQEIKSKRIRSYLTRIVLKQIKKDS